MVTIAENLVIVVLLLAAMANPRQRIVIVTLVASLMIAVTSPGLSAEPKVVAGYLENVRIMPSALELKAKLDTGADHSSLNATEIRIFRRGGKRWVSFWVENRDGKRADFELPVLRTARIKNLDGKSLRRPTVKLGVCLGPVFREVQVNLASRDGFKFNMLIGRSFMERRLTVDPARIYLTTPSCPEVANR